MDYGLWTMALRYSLRLLPYSVPNEKKNHVSLKSELSDTDNSTDLLLSSRGLIRQYSMYKVPRCQTSIISYHIDYRLHSQLL